MKLNIFSGLKNKKGKKAFQLCRDTSSKIQIILPLLEKMDVHSILDIGCNAGEITRYLGRSGLFSVGVDGNLDFRGIENPLNDACLGNIKLDMKMAKNLPEFDAILLLSVHHQMINSYGDEWTREFINQLVEKSKKLFLMEFAALNSKYGKKEGELFIDNDENSIIQYADNWLLQAIPQCTCVFVGKIPQKDNEPYRFLFQCVKSS